MNALDLIYAPIAIVTAPLWARKKREGWNERFGRIVRLPPRGEKPRVLLHAVSVGEVAALRALVPGLVARGLEVVVSASTDTGLQRARDLYAASAHVVRYPLDFSGAVARFLDAVDPDAVALVELELWPNFLRACRERRIPAGVVNGRLSERSFRGYRRIRPAVRRMFASLEFAAVQDADYAERFMHLGVPRERCLVTGSMKWDNATLVDTVPGADQLARDLGIDRSKPLIVAGSTGPIPGDSEEALLHRACPPEVQLLCAPRKPERFADASRALPGCVRRSATRTGGPPSPSSSGRFLLDSIGELRQAYALADVVVVGRSFGILYGSDPLEPVGLGKATVVGPAVADFALMVRALEEAGGIVRATRETLGGVLRRLVAEPQRRAELASRGRECIRKYQGASERHAELVEGLARGARLRKGV